MKFRLTVAILAVLTAGCIRRTEVLQAPVTQGQPADPNAKPGPKARTHASIPAAPTVWDRQIKNAKDAGDGDYELRVLRDKTAAEPDNIPARVELAKAYRERGYPDVALEICRLAASRFPDSAEAQLALATALRDMNRRSEAGAGLEAFLKTHAQAGPEYYSWLGIMRDESGQWEAAEPAHRKALELRPQAAYLHNNLGYNLLMQKKYAEGSTEFREALKLDPHSLVARNNLGLALAHQDAADAAIATWQAGSDAATAHNNMAAVLMEKGNYPAARKELETALSYNRDFQPAVKNLELVSRLDGQPVSLPVKSDQTWWERWKTGFLKLWVGPLDDSNKPAAKIASASTNGDDK
jgi:tetratricopeptide (TPR) repeat protein